MSKETVYFDGADFTNNSIVLENPNLVELNITDLPFHFQANGHKITIQKDGFLVDGVKVEQGENEAKEVYDAFKKMIGYSK